MAKNKKSRKSYNTSLKQRKFDKNDKFLGKIKIALLLLFVIGIAVITISQINH